MTTAKDLFARLGSEDSNKRSTAAQETANFVKSAGADAVQVRPSSSSTKATLASPVAPCHAAALPVLHQLDH